MQQQDFYLILSTIQQLFLLSLITIEEKGQLKDFYLNSTQVLTIDELTQRILQQVARLRRSHNKKMSISTELTAIGEETGEEGDFE
ncbi:hypothetical protein pb186bvf_013187 [Paramecium bursaria]